MALPLETITREERLIETMILIRDASLAAVSRFDPQAAKEFLEIWKMAKGAIDDHKEATRANDGREVAQAEDSYIERGPNHLIVKSK